MFCEQPAEGRRVDRVNRVDGIASLDVVDRVNRVDGIASLDGIDGIASLDGRDRGASL